MPGWNRMLRDLLTHNPPDINHDQNTIHDLISNQRRRHIIHTLVTEDRPVSINELATIIAGIEYPDVERPSSKQRKRIYISLYQTHLPRLDEHNVVNYTDQTVSQTRLTHEYHRIIEYSGGDAQ